MPGNNSLLKNLLFLFISVCTFNPSVNAQERKLVYDVMRNGEVIGTINFVEYVQGQRRLLSMISDVKTRYLFSFSDHTSETAGYDNGILVYSAFYQKQTGSGETNKSTIASGKFYKVTDDGVSKLVSFNPIRYSMLRLYIDIPDSINQVFSGNYQRLLDIKKIEENKYRLMLPGGKYNDYTYKNGVCTKVEIIRTLVSIQFVLKE